MAERVPDQVAALRAASGAKIAAKRAAMAINYDTAMMILKPIIDLLYMNVRDSILKDKANFSAVDPADAETIHQIIVSKLRQLQGREIPLGVVFGAAEALSPMAVDTITSIFGDNDQAKRSKFFRDVFSGTLKEQWFESFFGPDGPKLSIRFGRYGSKPAILLINADGEKDYLQYHITVSPDRIFVDPANGQELVRGYHFTNWFNGDGTHIKRNYFFNNGTVSRSINNAKTRRRNEKHFNETAAAVAAASSAAASAPAPAPGGGGGGSAEPPKPTQKQREAANRAAKRELEAKKAANIARITKEQKDSEDALLKSILNQKEAAAGAGGAGMLQNILAMLSVERKKTIIDYMEDSQTFFELAFFYLLLGASPDVKKFFYKVMNPFHRSDIAETTHDLILKIINNPFETRDPIDMYVYQIASSIVMFLESKINHPDVKDAMAFLQWFDTFLAIGEQRPLFKEMIAKAKARVRWNAPLPKPASKGGRRRSSRK